METPVNLLPKQPISGQFQFMWFKWPRLFWKFSAWTEKHTYNNKPLLGHIFVSKNALFLLYEERVSLVSGKKLCIYTKVN